MGKLGSLAKDTAIYGLSSIVGRFLNYLLVPLYTAKLAAASGGYGVITEVYSYVALLLVLLTFGMETTFFRFVNKEGENPKQVYANTLIAVGGVALLFAVAVLALIGPISTAMGYAEHPEFIGMMVDAMTNYGADSFVGRLSCIFQGSTDTTFYVLAVYFGSVGVKYTRHAVSCGLLADLAGIIAAIFICYLFFG